VVVCPDLKSHPAAKHARDLATSAGVPCVLGGNDASTILKNLQLRGIIRSEVDLSEASMVVKKERKVSLTNTQPYDENLASIIQTYCGERPTKFLIRFVKPEVDRCSTKLLRLLQKFSASPSEWEDGDLEDIGEKKWNLSAWRNELGISYEQGQRKLFALVIDGLVDRVEPFEGNFVGGGTEPAMSLNFRLSSKGIAQLRASQDLQKLQDDIAKIPPIAMKAEGSSPKEAAKVYHGDTVEDQLNRQLAELEEVSGFIAGSGSKVQVEPIQPSPDTRASLNRVEEPVPPALLPPPPSPPAATPVPQDPSPMAVKDRQAPPDIKDAVLILRSAILEEDPNILQISVSGFEEDLPTVEVVRKTSMKFVM
jgi:hypothetical protein